MGFIAPPDDVIDQRNVVMHVGAEIKQHYEPMHHLPNINASQSISAAGGGASIKCMPSYDGEKYQRASSIAKLLPYKSSLTGKGSMSAAELSEWRRKSSMETNSTTMPNLPRNARGLAAHEAVDTSAQIAGARKDDSAEDSAEMELYLRYLQTKKNMANGGLRTNRNKPLPVSQPLRSTLRALETSKQQNI